jgi:hypothetical protein
MMVVTGCKSITPNDLVPGALAPSAPSTYTVSDLVKGASKLQRPALTDGVFLDGVDNIK